MTTTDPKLIEPVAWMYEHPEGYRNVTCRNDMRDSYKGWLETPLYTAAAINEAAHQWQDKIDELRDMLADAYAAGATDTHNWWAAGNTEGEANFGEAASDYAASVIVRLTAIEAHKESQHG